MVPTAGAGGTAVAERKNQIPEQFAWIDNSLSLLEDVVSRLEARIAQVLNPESIKSPPATAEPSLSVPLAQNLSEVGNRIERIACFLNDVIRRVEL